jgi:hypothetical protein
MKFSTELFYQTVEPQEYRLNLGNVQKWHSASFEDSGVLVFYSVKSECSGLATGVYVVYLDDSGQFSQVAPITVGEITTLNLISDPERNRMAAFIIRDGGTLEVIVWDQDRKSIPNRIEFDVEMSYERIELALYDEQVGILLVSDYEFALYQYNWKKTSLIGKQKYEVGSGGKAFALFQNFGSLYAVLPQSGNQLSSLKSPCTLQVL